MNIINTVFEHCPVCGKDHNINICEQETVAEYKGVRVKYNDISYVCDLTPENAENGNSFYPGLMFNENARRMKDSYRKSVGLLTSQNITELRNELNLSQEDFAEFVNIDCNYLKKIETIKPQTTKENNKFLFLKNNIELIKDLLAENTDIKKAGIELDKYYIKASE